jgi:hypothetical protein
MNSKITWIDKLGAIVGAIALIYLLTHVVVAIVRGVFI